jgi:phosphate transport system permease protein
MTVVSRPLRRRRPPSEGVIEGLLLLAAGVGVLTTVGIGIVLLVEAVQCFALVNPLDFLTGTVWSASILPFRFGVIPLVVSTLEVALLALTVAVPLGLLSAIYLAEYTTPRTRDLVKPITLLLNLASNRIVARYRNRYA